MSNVASETMHHDEHEHHEQSFVSKYIFSMDHKMISKQFLITGLIMGLIGMTMSVLFRMQLAWPDKSFPIFDTLFGRWSTDGHINPDFYMALVTMHGTIMVFFVLTAGLSGTFSNLLIPYQVGCRDMASPFLNMLSYWFFFASSVILMSSLFVQTGPASGGWTVYPPLSALPKAMPGSGLGMTLWLVSMIFFIGSSLLGGINYVVTILNMRTHGLTMTRLPLTMWAFFFTAVLGILSFPVLLSGSLLLVFDRSFGTSFYLSEIFIDGHALTNAGGSPILWQHLFWFLGHPEVYIIILPALGITSEVVATNSRKPIFGYKAMIGSIMGIAAVSFFVWGHHMFVTGMNPLFGSVFMFITFLVAIPSAVKTFNYLATMWRGNIRFTPAMLFGVGLVSLFVTGGLTGIFLGNAALDIPLHDSYFVVAHFHIVMGSSAIFGLLCGVYHWFPRMYGRMMNPQLGYLHFWLSLIGVYMVFFPMHFMGLGGVPRRYYAFTAWDQFAIWNDMNEFITIGAIIGSFAQLIFLYNFVSSIFFGKKSVQNPWGSNTLEWTAPVEQIHGNWPGEVPKVYRWPYDYSRPDAEQDFVPQNVPDDVVPVEWAGDPHGAASSHKEVSGSDAKAESVVHFSWFKKLGMRLGVL